MAALMRYLKYLKDRAKYKAHRRKLQKLSESTGAPQDPLWLITPDQQDTTGGNVVSPEEVADRALYLYVAHNRARVCRCKGCTGIRDVLAGYFERIRK